MNKLIIMTLVTTGVLAAFCHQLIDDAMRAAKENGCLSDRDSALQIPNWGVPDQLFSEPAFTNLVNVVRSNVMVCGADYVSSLTNDVDRALFVAALTACGSEVFRESVVGWFGSQTNQVCSNISILNSFIHPIATELEDYMSMHYDAPGISNVLVNARNMYLASSNSVSAAAMDCILSGETRASKLSDLQCGLIECIKDGTSR